MTTVTIPKTLAQKGDLVMIPLKEYEALLLGRKQVKTVALTKAQRHALLEARRQLARGEYRTLEEVRHAVGRYHR